MFTFLLVVHAIIAASLVTVILMQRSEGGGLGMGSGPSGLMTARGAADFLTRATTVLATLFVLMAFLLATLASLRNSGGQIDTSLAGQAAPGVINAPAAPAPPTSAIPMMGTPAPATSDGLTSPALARESAGPQASPSPAPQPQPQPQPTRHVAPSSLKTIDTRAPAVSVGINGVASKPASMSAPPSAPATSKPIPTINIPAPVPAGGNGSQPQ